MMVALKEAGSSEGHAVPGAPMAHPPPILPTPRLFTLHVPAPPSLLLSLVYKLERPKALGVALELTTAPMGTCHVSGISVPNGESEGDGDGDDDINDENRGDGDGEGCRSACPGVWKG